jgi:hypothetical protein
MHDCDVSKLARKIQDIVSPYQYPCADIILENGRGLLTPTQEDAEYREKHLLSDQRGINDTMQFLYSNHVYKESKIVICMSMLFTRLEERIGPKCLIDENRTEDTARLWNMLRCLSMMDIYFDAENAHKYEIIGMFRYNL